MCSCSCSLNQPIEARKSFLYAQLTQATYDCEVGLSLAHEKCGLAVSVLVILGVQLHFWTCNVGKFSARDTWLTRQDKQGITHTHKPALGNKSEGWMRMKRSEVGTSQLHVHIDRSLVTLELWGILATFRHSFSASHHGFPKEVQSLLSQRFCCGNDH
jgi:hypothetical protein